MTDLDAALEAINLLAVHTCGGCDQPLDPDGPSPDFCGPHCQAAWRRQQADRLVGYREPFGPDGWAQGDLWSLDTGVASYQPGSRECACGRWFRPRPGGIRGDECRQCALRRAHEEWFNRCANPVDRTSAPSEFMAAVQGPPASELFEECAAAFSRVSETITDVVQALGPVFARASEALEQAGVISTLPTDPRERALELRRRRNTGPAAPQRAPRRIDPRRQR